MKLELKHLAAYLPYNLEMKGLDGSIALLNCDSGISLGKYGIEWVLRTQKAKPILRPLSDLTKEIEVNGEKFVPIEWLIKNYTIYRYQFIEDKFYSLNFSKYVLYTEMPYDVVQKLHEWHFDTFGLIDAGLAIDINTLNK